MFVEDRRPSFETVTMEATPLSISSAEAGCRSTTLPAMLCNNSVYYIITDIKQGLDYTRNKSNSIFEEDSYILGCNLVHWVL
jgi:hypothetical protein